MWCSVTQCNIKHTGAEVVDSGGGKAKKGGTAVKVRCSIKLIVRGTNINTPIVLVAL